MAVNCMLRNELGAEKGRAILYGASILIKSIETDELRWQTRESGTQPSAQQIAQQIREAMRQADEQVPGPPGPEDGGDK